MYPNPLKYVLDYFAAILALIILSPVIIIVTIGLYIANNGKPFFYQERPGKDEDIFQIVKFKTMNDRKGKDGTLLPDSERLTNIGKFVRKTSLDEIPQLFNVLNGDMSIVGPRPLLTEYLPLYNNFQKKRHNVKPGITGWAQVNGRNAISWKKKFELDVWYVENQSFNLDLRILLKTIKKVFCREDISSEGQATTTIFKGEA